MSSFDAAHFYVTTAKSPAGVLLSERLPVLTPAIVFEVVDGKVHRVEEAALQRRIVKRRQGIKGPRVTLQPAAGPER